MVWAKRTSKSIPSIGTRNNVYEINDYSKGFNTFLSNDKLPFESGKSNLWRLAKNARITTLGEYGTRQGIDFHSAPAGETEDDTITSVAGAADADFNQVTRLAQVFTSAATARLSKVLINIKNDSSATGTVMVEIWSDVSSAPGVLLARSSIKASDVASSYGYITARFAEAPVVTATEDYWIVVYTQASGSNSYSWSSTTAETTALTSVDSGTTWATTTYALNFKEYYATSGGIKGLFRAVKNDGTKVTLFVQGTVLYSVNNTTGALTAIKTGLSSSATRYTFKLVNDIVYYVNGYDGLRKWNFTTESQVNSTNYSTICIHKGLLFGARMDDKSRVDFSNFGEYEVFTSTDFVYAPAPMTGDPITALESINGYLIVATLNNKYILSGDDNATFSVDEAPDQKGTYSQETIDADKNFIYYLSNDGVYQSNGSEAQMLSTDIYEDILKLPNKDTAVLKVNNGRLYLWYTPSGESENSQCYVFSLNYGDSGGTTESLDTKSFVSRAVSGPSDDDVMLVASSRLGQVYWQEEPSNDYTNLGGDIDFELDTHYIVGSSPAILKQIRKYQPRFEAQSADYTINVEYAYEMRNNWTLLSSVNVLGSGVVYGGGATYGSGETYGTQAETQSYLYIPGSYRRIAVRYKHYATRQPHTFLGHTILIQSRRLR